MLIGIAYGDTSPIVAENLSRDLPAGVELVLSKSLKEMPRAAELEGVIGYWQPTESDAPRLRWIHWPNAGVEDVPEHMLESRQWQLTHGGGPGAVPIGEWTLGVMLFFSHRFRDILRYEHDRSWHVNRGRDMSFRPLRDATVGIMGYGAIGREIGRLCKSFGMKVHASLGFHGKQQYPTYRTPGTGDPDGVIPDKWYEYSDLTKVLPEWDYVVLCQRVTEKTKHIIDSETLKCFKPSGVLINIARGALIDEAALIDALKAGRLGGAALDVFETEPLPADDPLRDAPNILISPHCSPESPYYRDEIYASIAENLRRFASGEQLLNVVVRR